MYDQLVFKIWVIIYFPNNKLYDANLKNMSFKKAQTTLKKKKLKRKQGVRKKKEVCESRKQNKHYLQCWTILLNMFIHKEEEEMSL